jgi:hypothetical protein
LFWLFWRLRHVVTSVAAVAELIPPSPHEIVSGADAGIVLQLFVLPPLASGHGRMTSKSTVCADPSVATNARAGAAVNAIAISTAKPTAPHLRPATTARLLLNTITPTDRSCPVCSTANLCSQHPPPDDRCQGHGRAEDPFAETLVRRKPRLRVERSPDLKLVWWRSLLSGQTREMLALDPAELEGRSCCPRSTTFRRDCESSARQQSRPKGGRLR